MVTLQDAPTSVKGRRVRCITTRDGAPLLLVVSQRFDAVVPIGFVSPDDARLQVDALAFVWGA